MRVLARAGLAAIAASMVLGACSTVEPRIQEASPLPEPPPWNSIEMLWLETEVVFLQVPLRRLDAFFA
jgi:hypothetical protein